MKNKEVATVLGISIAAILFIGAYLVSEIGFTPSDEYVVSGYAPISDELYDYDSEHADELIHGFDNDD